MADEPRPELARGLLIDVFVNGTHPLLPWLAFFCAGIVLGRMLGARVVAARCDRNWFRAVLGRDVDQLDGHHANANCSCC